MIIIPADMGPALAACAGFAFFIGAALWALEPERKAARAKRRAAREEFERRVIADEIDQRNKANLDRALAMSPPPMEPGTPWHPLAHQRRPVNPQRAPGAISLEGAALRLVEGEVTGSIPRHLAPSGWGQR